MQRMHDALTGGFVGSVTRWVRYVPEPPPLREPGHGPSTGRRPPWPRSSGCSTGEDRGTVGTANHSFPYSGRSASSRRDLRDELGVDPVTGKRKRAQFESPGVRVVRGIGLHR
jgi:hypothetical protein